MSGKFASLHSGLLVRAQIGNGGFVPDSSGATPNVARLAAQAAAEQHVRQPRSDSASIHTHRTFSPAPERRAELLPPGSVSLPEARARPQHPTFGARGLLARANEEVRRWDQEEEQAEQPKGPWPAQPSAAASEPAAPTPIQPTEPLPAPMNPIPPQAEATSQDKPRRKAMTLRL